MGSSFDVFVMLWHSGGFLAVLCLLACFVGWVRSFACGVGFGLFVGV